MSRVLLVCAAATAALAAEGAPAPNLSVGDTWTYDRVFETGAQGFVERRVDLRIDRIGVDTMVIGIKPSGATRAFEDHIGGLDWSLRRLIDGQQTVTGRPMSFPLSVGKTWTADYLDPSTHGRQLSAHFKTRYRVTGMEDVTVPAGTFHAYKIVAEGEIEARMAPMAAGVAAVTATPDGATTVTHTDKSGPSVVHATSYEEIFYDPKVKYFVKTVEDQFNSENVRTSHRTDVLQSYAVKP